MKVTEDFTFDEPKTKQVIDLLNAFELTGKKVLILIPENDYNVYKSARNLPGVEVIEAGNPTSYQILNSDFILIQNSAIAALEKSVNPKIEESVA